MKKQRFLMMIAMCMFCLTVVHAEDNPVEKKLKAYPNPVERSAVITIEIPNDRGEMTLFLYNTVGKEIQRVITSDKRIEFQAPDISGIYLLRFVEKQKVIAVEKIVVKE